MLGIREHKILVFVVLLMVCGIALRVGWVLNGPEFERVASAQDSGAGQEQYIAPDSSSGGTIVFSGSGADTVSTETFQIDSNQWTVTSESDPTGNNPLVFVETADGDIIDTEDDTSGGLNEPSVSTVNAEPGEFRLEISPLVDNASYTVTVASDAGATGQQQYQEAPTEPSDGGNPPLMDAGGPKNGPVPPLPSGGCPEEFPVDEDGACFGVEVR